MTQILDEYRTSDIGLATLLIMSGNNMRSCQKEDSSRKMYFYFENSELVQKIGMSYFNESENLPFPPLAFLSRLKGLKAYISSNESR